MTPVKKKKMSLTRQIVWGLVLGIVTGIAVSHFGPDKAHFFQPFSTLFVRLIKMIVAPVIFTSLVAGIAGAGHYKDVGRMGIRALIYFEVVTTLALAIGLVIVNVVRPGDGLVLPHTALPAELLARKPQTWDQIMLHLVPTSFFEAMAQDDVLQIVVFSSLFAVALGMIGERGKPIVELCERGAQAMFKLCDIVMRYAPIGVAASMAYAVGSSGTQILLNLLWLILSLYGALIIFVAIVLVPIALYFKIPLRKFWRMVKDPAVIAFSTTSSEAALPRAMENLERFGVPRRIVSFILPLGYSFNLDGSTLYLSLAAVFIAQVSGVELSIGQQITILITLMITSKGVAAVPRATLVILAGTLADFGLPLEGLTLILGVDAILDMARTCTNVVGNCLATVVIAKWEGEFNPKNCPDTYDLQA
jgi:proton glutamate symport protein